MVEKISMLHDVCVNDAVNNYYDDIVDISFLVEEILR